MKTFNSLVRIYLKRYHKVLDKVRTNSLELQQKELKRILSSPIYRGIDEKSFFEQEPTLYKDYKSEVDSRLLSGKGTFHSISVFAKSAGTSGNYSKLIPTSDAFLKRNHIPAGWLTMSLMYALRPDMDIISKKNLLVGGAIYDRTKNYTIADISGLLIEKIPRIFHRFYLPSIAEATMPDWEKKLMVTARKAADTDEVVMFAGVPTWILTLAKEVLSISSKRNLIEVWPNLKVYLHGGVKMKPYLEQFQRLIPKEAGVLFMEIYNASEGFFAIQDTLINHGMLLLTCHGVYYEFITLRNYREAVYRILPLSEVVCKEEYVMLITTLSGLCRYVMGDTVSFTSRHPFRLTVKGRINEFINAFGEDLTLEVANNAITDVCENGNALIRNYTVAPQYISLNDKGCHQWYIEFEKPPNCFSSFESELDEKVKQYNFNYAQKRSDDIALSKLEVINLPRGFYDSFAKIKNKFGGQNKLPKLRNDRSLADEIEAMMKSELWTREHSVL